MISSLLKKIFEMRSLHWALLFSAAFSGLPTSNAISPEVARWLDFEGNSNAMIKVDTTSKIVSYLEVPVSLLEIDQAERVDPKITEALFYKKNDIQFFKWVIQPTDSYYFGIVQQFLRDRGFSDQIQVEQRHLAMRRSASRSLFIESFENGAQFTFKTSTNNADGRWKDKHQDLSDTHDIRRIADDLYQLNKKQPFKYIVIQDEPLSVSIREINQSVVIRTLGDIATPEKHLNAVPLFSALHESAGKKIANQNGARNAAQFWRENAGWPLGRALGELAARSGYVLDSPHAQNYLVELDRSMEPTGRIIVRDIGDMKLQTTLLHARGASKIIEQYSNKRNLMKYHIDAAIGYFLGSKLPSWMTEDDAIAMAYDFFDGFERSFEKYSNFRLDQKETPPVGSPNRYLQKSYALELAPARSVFLRALCGIPQIKKLLD